MGLTFGVLWLAGAATAAIGAALPDSPSTDVVPFAITEAVFVAYGVACLLGWIPWERMSVRAQALTVGAVLPLLGVTIWATGGVDSFVQPLVLFPLLTTAYFFEPRQSIPLIAVLIAVFASPIVYAGSTGQGVYPARALAVAVGAIVMTIFVRMLKLRLMAAEQRQREMATTDPLTGLANRRLFDDALSAALARGEPGVGRRAADVEHQDAVLLLIDLDDFKLVNDSYGHAAGDDLLKAVAAHCLAVVRPGDTVARIGGDEFAVVAPRAGRDGARRLAGDLADAIERAGGRATIAWATHPEDGEDQEAMLRAADHRLYERKARRGALISA